MLVYQGLKSSPRRHNLVTVTRTWSPQVLLQRKSQIMAFLVYLTPKMYFCDILSGLLENETVRKRDRSRFLETGLAKPD